MRSPASTCPTSACWPPSSRCWPPRAGARRCSSRASTCSPIRPSRATSTSCAARFREPAGRASRWSATTSKTIVLGLPSELALQLVMDIQHGSTAGGAGRHRDHRHANRRHNGRRRPLPGPPGQPGARPHRQSRYRLLERSPALPGAARPRGDPDPLAAAGEPPGAGGDAGSGDRPGRAGGGQLGGGRAWRGNPFVRAEEGRCASSSRPTASGPAWPARTPSEPCPGKSSLSAAAAAGGCLISSLRSIHVAVGRPLARSCQPKGLVLVGGEETGSVALTAAALQPAVEVRVGLQQRVDAAAGVARSAWWPCAAPAGSAAVAAARRAQVVARGRRRPARRRSARRPGPSRMIVGCFCARWSWMPS